MTSRRQAAPAAVTLLGLALTVLALAWWWSIFGRVVDSETITLRQAATCLAAGSDLCTLAQALCTQDHPLGLRWYAPEGFWAAVAVAGAGAALSLRATRV